VSHTKSESTSPSDASPSLGVLFADVHLLVVNKPSGLLVHNGWGREAVTALSLARSLAGTHVHPLHRLDRSTSGVLAFALSPEVARLGQACLAASDACKLYVALVRGYMPDAAIVDHPLAPPDGGEHREALTHLACLQRIDGYSLVLARPLTGRTHQIRRHLKHLSHPLIGDVRYGKGEHNRRMRDSVGLHRLALHALSLRFSHPVSHEPLKTYAPLPEDLLHPLELLGFGEALASLCSMRWPHPALQAQLDSIAAEDNPTVCSP
jgi:tRNA pseudouridine65 synthase